jgi:hypothetical protein
MFTPWNLFSIPLVPLLLFNWGEALLKAERPLLKPVCLG